MRSRQLFLSFPITASMRAICFMPDVSTEPRRRLRDSAWSHYERERLGNGQGASPLVKVSR
jgi:hypothetical protein